MRFAANSKLRKLYHPTKKSESVIISDTEITSEQLEKALDGSGYRILGYECVRYEKKGLFSK